MALVTSGLLAFEALPASAVDITSTGPLTAIGVGTTLDCSANHVGDTAGEFFGGTSCGTFTVVDGVLYGPFLGATYTPVSQTGPTGSGTNADPYRIVTVVDAGATGVRLTQTDTYTTGLESFRTDVAVANTTAASHDVRVYRAADCYLQNSDTGYGVVDVGTGAVACTTGLESGARIEQWFPITSGSHYYEDHYSMVYNQITSLLPFPDTCGCATFQDNGAGLSWDATIAAGASKTFSSFITFSPLGILPLSMSVTPDAASVPSGGTAGYTIQVANPNGTAVSLATVTDALPATFSYVAGSSTGLTTANPSIGGGNVLTWNGPLSVPGSGSASLHFSATVGTTTGTFTSSAAATNDGGYTIAPTGPDGAVTVTGGTVNPLALVLTPGSANASVGTDHTFTVAATRGAVPQAGVDVAFSVISGPEIGFSANAPTDGSGHAAFVVHGGGTGTDVVSAGADDGGTPISSNTASVTWTPVGPSGITVQGLANPPAITAGSAGLVHFEIHNNGPGTVVGVFTDVTLPAGATGVSTTISQGGCTAFTGVSAICLIGAIPAGGTVNLDVVEQTPTNFAPFANAGILVTLHGLGIDPVNDVTGPDVVPPTPGEAIGFVPPGGTISTGTNATPENNTVASFRLPNSGGGAPIVLRTETDGVATFCGGSTCSGKILFLSPFEGYTNKRAPARLKVTWDKTVAGKGTKSKIYVQKEVGGPITRVPTCENTEKHIADPSPCIHKKEKLENGDIRFEIVLLSGDPRFARR
jgi:conserved repeat domain